MFLCIRLEISSQQSNFGVILQKVLINFDINETIPIRIRYNNILKTVN